MMSTFTFLDTYVLRTAALPVSFYTNLLQNYSTNALFKAVEHSFVKNAIRLASPELLQEYEKYNSNPLSYSVKKAITLELSLLKYISRMCSRDTPFGLFAGCSTGTLSDETDIVLNDSYTAHTQFDMQFWITLVQKWSQNKHVQKQLTYFPNTSLYVIGDFYRYVEFRYENKKRVHSISSFRKNPFLELILRNAYNGSKIKDLAHAIIETESEREEAIAFIEELIENQILVSNLEVAVTGSNEVERILAIIGNCKDVETEKTIIKNIYDKINLTANPSDLNQTYANYIWDKTKELEVNFEEKYLLQTDLYVKKKSNTLNKSNVRKLTKVIHFLSRIQDLEENLNLENFKNAFQKRYENKEMPLSIVLDPEIGIGFLQNTSMNDSHPILDKFSISNIKKSDNTEFWSANEYLFEKKLLACIANQEDKIIFQDEDFAKINNQNREFPATFSAMIEVINDKDKEVIVLESLGNFSASKLIGRFCNGSLPIHRLADEIIGEEACYNKDVIYAEIAHIPES